MTADVILNLVEWEAEKMSYEEKGFENDEESEDEDVFLG